MALLVQLIFALFSLISITVATEVFGQTGSSVQLDIQIHGQKFDDLYWKFNQANNILKYSFTTKTYKLYTDYKDRVEFNQETYSLTLKNLEKTDSGLYKAAASGEKDVDIAEYQLSVLDPVKAPVISYPTNRSTCNTTIFCRGHHLNISSICSKDSCEEKSVTSPAGVTLSLSVNSSSIICKQSNKVSWKTDELKLKKLCPDEDAVPSSAGGSLCFLKTVLWPITLILMLSV